MKKIIALVLAVCLLFSLSGCVSQNDYDALLAQQQTLQANIDALQADHDSLKATLDKHTDLIDAMEAEDFGAAMDIVSQKQIAKEVAEKGDIEEYLVTVELTLDNFDDYFEWKAFYGLNSFGEPEKHNMSVVPVSKVYDQGLILYQIDLKLGYAFTFSDSYQGRVNSDTINETREWSNNSIFGTGISSSEGVVFDLENFTMDVNRLEGTVTFVKEEYVTSYELGELERSTQNATITLVNGEVLLHTVQFGCKY